MHILIRLVSSSLRLANQVGVPGLISIFDRYHTSPTTIAFTPSFVRVLRKLKFIFRIMIYYILRFVQKISTVPSNARFGIPMHVTHVRTKKDHSHKSGPQIAN
jgi:hypothetical protein